MLIDNFTVIAQLINFLILVWLLKRFLYRPVLRAIDTREKRLQEAQFQAEQEQKQAQEAREQLRAEQLKLQEQSAAILEQARAEAREQKRRDLDRARSEINTKQQQWREQLNNEQQALQKQLRDCTLEQLCRALNQALSDLADIELQEQIIRHFAKRLRNLSDPQQEQLRRISSDTSAAPMVNTLFMPDHEQQQLIRSALADLGLKPEPVFRTAASMGCGIQLVWESFNLSWSTTTYVKELETLLHQRLEMVIEQNTAPAVKTPPQENA